MENYNSDNKVIKQAKKLFAVDVESWAQVYKSAQDDLDFLSDKEDAQWEPQAYQIRRRNGLPTLTLDKLSQFTRQVVNQIKINTPTINVIPSDGTSDEDIADVFKGLIKNIEYSSNADDAYDNAVMSSVRCGIGFIRVDHEYEDDGGFNQVLKILRVVNPLSTWIDSNSISPDGSDAKHAFVQEIISIDNFKAKYKGKDPVSFLDNAGTLNNSPDGDDNEISLVEFFQIEESKDEIAIYGDNGEIVPYDPKNPEEPTHRREVRRKEVKRYLLSGVDILEETTFPGDFIPIIPVYGEETWVKGKRFLSSLIRKAKVPQMIHNYWKSVESELLQKQPQAPWVSPHEAIEGYEESWKDPSKAAVLLYNMSDENGAPVDRPARSMPPVMSQAMAQSSISAVDDIKSAMGMYGSSLGQQTNETSGIAIQRRKQEGEIGQYHFSDNLVKSISHIGRVLVNTIPKIYDTNRVVRIVGAEDETEMVGVNGDIVDGQKETIDLSQGKYDVRVTTGSSFTTMRQEASDFMGRLVQSSPDIMTVAGDLIFENMDIPGAEAIASRLKKSMPPELLKSDDENELSPEIQQMSKQLEEAVATIQQMQEQIDQSEEALSSKEGDLTIKAHSESNKAQANKDKVDIEIARLELEKQQNEFNNAIKIKELELENDKLQMQKLEITARINDDLDIKSSIIGCGESHESEMLGDDANENGENEHE